MTLDEAQHLLEGAQLEPLVLGYQVVGTDAATGQGAIEYRRGAMLFRAECGFSLTSNQSSRRVVQTTIAGVPTLVVGQVSVIDGDTTRIVITEIRLGSDVLDPVYVAAKATYEHMDGLLSYRVEDGTARAPGQTFALSALGDAPPMELSMQLLPTPTLRLESVEPAPLEHFETHLAAFQDLLTFAVDQPSGRLSLSMLDSSATSVRILVRNRFEPFNLPTRRPVEYSLRLGANSAGLIVSTWWNMRVTLRPVEQVLAGLAYRPGYVESALIGLFAVTEKFAKAQFDLRRAAPLAPAQLAPIREALLSVAEPDADQQAVIDRILNNRYVYASLKDYLIALSDDLGSELIDHLRILPLDWQNHFAWARNDIAHEGAPNETRGDQFVSETESRALRDATKIILTCAILKHLGVPTRALLRSAERLGNRYANRHPTATFFRATDAHGRPLPPGT